MILLDMEVGLLGCEQPSGATTLKIGPIVPGTPPQEATDGVASGADMGALGPDLCWLRLKFKVNPQDDTAVKRVMEPGRRFRLLLEEV